MTACVRVEPADVIAAWAIAQANTQEIVVNLPSGAAARVDDLRRWAARWPKCPPLGHLPAWDGTTETGQVGASELTIVDLRDRRIRAGLSQSELGQRMGSTQTLICALETGRYRPGSGLRDRWIAALPPAQPVAA